MLCYLGRGERRYGEKPSPIHARPYWEFQAVLSGRIGMLLKGQDAEFAARTLWLTAPGHRHGWVGDAQAAKVAVFHFLSIPELVKRRFLESTCRRTALTIEQCRRLGQLADSLADVWRMPQPDMPLRHEHLLLELSLVVSTPEAAPVAAREKQRRERVQSALNWFHLNMQYNPSLEEVANATGASAVHLRRLFHEVMQDSPKKVFDQLRFQRAIHLMTDHKLTLESVGENCGFQSASAFSRAFKQKFGCSPDQWRGNQRVTPN